MIGNPQSEACFEALRADREAIQKAFGEPLNWYSVEGVKMRRVFARQTADLENCDDWPEYHQWLTERLDRLHEIFQDRVKALDVEALGRAGASLE